jgi:hypothetical protein
MYLRNPRWRAVLLSILVGIPLAVPSSSTVAHPSTSAVSASSAASRASASFDPPPPAAIEPSASYQFGVTTVAISDTLLYYGEEKALDIVDVSNPLEPIVLSRTPLPRVVFNIVVVGHYVYASISAETGQGLQIIDVSNPSAPILRGLYPLKWSNTVKVIGNLAYVGGTTSEGFVIIDVSDPDNPTLVGRCCDGSSVQGIQVVGSLAYIGQSFAIRIVDISQPTNPTRLANGYFSGTWNISDLQIVGNRIYRADVSRGLEIIELTSPTVMKGLGLYETRGGALDLEIIGSSAYFVSGLYGFNVVDISNPATPQLRSTYALEGLAQELVIKNQIAYIASGEGGLQILDLHDSTKPRLLKRLFPVVSKVYMPSVLRYSALR